MIDATYLKIHKIAASLKKKAASPEGLNSKVYAIRDASGRPIHTLPPSCQ